MREGEGFRRAGGWDAWKDLLRAIVYFKAAALVAALAQ